MGFNLAFKGLTEHIAFSNKKLKTFRRVGVSNDSLNENTFSNWGGGGGLNYGVPRGEILGPFL
jgi:hypothetical protein